MPSQTREHLAIIYTRVILTRYTGLTTLSSDRTGSRSKTSLTARRTVFRPAHEVGPTSHFGQFSELRVSITKLFALNNDWFEYKIFLTLSFFLVLPHCNQLSGGLFPYCGLSVTVVFPSNYF